MEQATKVDIGVPIPKEKDRFSTKKTNMILKKLTGPPVSNSIDGSCEFALIQCLEQSAFKNHAFKINFDIPKNGITKRLIFIVNLGWSRPHSCIKKRDDPQLYWVE